MRHLLLLLLRAYRYALSPLLGNQCRFAPTCSLYAMEAIERHGAAEGSLLALRRVCKCHPWHAGGCDPVPPARTRDTISHDGASTRTMRARP